MYFIYCGVVEGFIFKRVPQRKMLEANPFAPTLKMFVLKAEI